VPATAGRGLSAIKRLFIKPMKSGCGPGKDVVRRPACGGWALLVQQIRGMHQMAARVRDALVSPDRSR
jgi:hypothetical protein